MSCISSDSGVKFQQACSMCVCMCAHAHMYVYVKGLFVNQLIYSKIFSFSTFILHTLTRSSTISSTLDSQMIGHSVLFSMVTNMICRKMLVQIIVLFQCEFRITLCLPSYCKMSSFSVYQTLVQGGIYGKAGQNVKISTEFKLRILVLPLAV